MNVVYNPTRTQATHIHTHTRNIFINIPAQHLALPGYTEQHVTSSTLLYLTLQGY